MRLQLRLGENMLEQILKYHQQLVSEEFIENLIKKIEHQYRLRQTVIGLFVCLGLIAGVIGFIKIWPESFMIGLEGITTESIIMLATLVVSFILFVLWLSNEELSLL